MQSPFARGGVVQAEVGVGRTTAAARRREVVGQGERGEVWEGVAIVVVTAVVFFL